MCVTDALFAVDVMDWKSPMDVVVVIRTAVGLFFMRSLFLTTFLVVLLLGGPEDEDVPQSDPHQGGGTFEGTPDSHLF